MKETLAIFAVIVGLVGILPYVRDMLHGRTRPHAFTWLVWGLLGVTALVYSLGDGETLSVSLYAVQAANCLGIAAYAWIRYGRERITRFDWVCLSGALAGLAVYAALRDGLLAAIIVAATDFLGFLPTFRKSWHHSHGETLANYVLGVISYSLLLASLSAYTLTVTLYPLSYLVSGSAFCLMLVLRRRALARPEGLANSPETGIMPPLH